MIRIIIVSSQENESSEKIKVYAYSSEITNQHSDVFPIKTHKSLSHTFNTNKRLVEMSDTEQQENLVIELQTFDSCYEAEGPRILLDNKIVNSHSRLTNQIKTYISRDVDTKLAGITSLQVFQEIFFSQDEQGETFLHFCAKKNASKCCRIFLLVC